MAKHLIIYSVLAGVLLCGCTSREPVAEDSGSSFPDPVRTPENSFFDSLRLHSPFTGTQFVSLQKADSVHWHLVTDLLNYYYALRWNKENREGEPDLLVQTLEQRLKKASAWWRFPQGLSPDREYAFLLKESTRLSDFPVDNKTEEHYRGGLLRFMKMYLSARCKEKLDSLPKSLSLARALEYESATWRNYQRAEIAFYDELSTLLGADRYSELGMERGEFLDNRRLRQEETERSTYFALAAPSYTMAHAGYVTWAEMQQEYATLQERLSRIGGAGLRTALSKESAAWFAFAKARTAVEELLGGSAQKVYATQTRILKGYHLKDLKSW